MTRFHPFGDIVHQHGVCPFGDIVCLGVRVGDVLVLDQATRTRAMPEVLDDGEEHSAHLSAHLHTQQGHNTLFWVICQVHQDPGEELLHDTIGTLYHNTMEVGVQEVVIE